MIRGSRFDVDNYVYNVDLQVNHNGSAIGYSFCSFLDKERVVEC